MTSIIIFQLSPMQYRYFVCFMLSLKFFVCFANFGTGTDLNMRSWSEAFLAMDLIRTITRSVSKSESVLHYQFQHLLLCISSISRLCKNLSAIVLLPQLF